MLSPNGSSDTCISNGVFHIPMPCFHGAPPLAHSVHHARAAPRETTCGVPAHHHRSPSRVALAHFTRRASPNIAPDAFDNESLAVCGMLGVVARRVPIPEGDTTGSRATHGLGH